MSEPAYYLWVEEKPEHRDVWDSERKKPQFPRMMMPLKAKHLEDAKLEAVACLDEYAMTDGVYLDLRHAIIYEFKTNVTMLYEEGKDKRHIHLITTRKQEELKKAEAEVARLKKELGEG